MTKQTLSCPTLWHHTGLYFNKIQCFCFEEQRLKPKEEIDMPVRRLPSLRDYHHRDWSPSVSFFVPWRGWVGVGVQVFFFIDPEILNDRTMDNVHEITLSYTFFKTGEEDAIQVSRVESRAWRQASQQSAAPL